MIAREFINAISYTSSRAPLRQVMLIVKKTSTHDLGLDQSFLIFKFFCLIKKFSSLN
jgi:hypothetical protein